MLHGLGDQPVDHLRGQVEPGRGQPGPDPPGVHPAVRRGRHRTVRQPLRPHPVDDHGARPQAGRGQLVDRLQGLGDRQVLQQRHQVHRGQLGVQHRTTPSAWLWIGPLRARSAIALVTSRKLTTRPVGGASSTTAS